MRRIVAFLGVATVASSACGGGGAGAVADATGADAGGAADGAAVEPAPSACAFDVAAIPIDPSAPGVHVVGDGSPSSCTEAALAAAVAHGGTVTFRCGGAATIAITHAIELARDADTVIDGGGLVTLDGGGATRILHFDGGDFRKTRRTITLQHIAFSGGRATGTPIPPAPPPCSQGYGVDGGGGAILVNDGILHVIDATFTGNRAASPGPDVAGGAVYATGALEVTIVGSRFIDNAASNGGAVGSLFSNVTVTNSIFERNRATGTGANTIDPACTVGNGESGDGGNGGAIVIDGGEDFAVHLCGDVFRDNAAGALGGGVFRTPDLARQATLIDRATFDGNQAKGGGALYMHHADLTIRASTFSANRAEGAGALQADDTNLAIENATFSGNEATAGLGGAISLFGNGGTVKSATFAENHADGGSGLFAAAIAGGTALEITNTLFAGNTTQDCGAPMTCADGASTGASNLQWPKAHVVCANDDPPCATGTTFADPQLGALADHGGPTQTRAPAAGSPAIGGGKGCPAVDQRGNPRKADGCTIGAYEAP